MHGRFDGFAIVFSGHDRKKKYTDTDVSFRIVYKRDTLLLFFHIASFGAKASAYRVNDEIEFMEGIEAFV